jgi:hypothetical protein
MPFYRIALVVVLFLVLLGILSTGIHYFTQNNNLGTDFFIFWQSGRAVFLEHTSPYRDDLTVQSQLTIFKRLARPDEDHLTFAYPPFALLIILPFVFLPFEWAQAVWISLLILLLVSAFALSYPKAPKWVGISFLAFYQVFFGLILGNFVVLFTALLILLLGIYLPRERPTFIWQLLAGFFTAWLAAKLQFTWPFLLFLGLSGLRNRQWCYLVSAFISLVTLLMVSFLMVPNWPAEWFTNINLYAAYNQSWPIATYLIKQILQPETAVWVSVGLGVICLGITTWFILRWWYKSMNALTLLAWLGFVGYLFHPRGASYEQIAFLLPLVVWTCEYIGTQWRPVYGWWLVSLVVSWGAFFISMTTGLSIVNEIPLLFHSFWIAWILRRESLVIRS